MRIVTKLVPKDEEGEIGLLIENSEDLWAVYNLIVFGDKVSCTTTRKVVKETGTSTQTNKVKIYLQICVEKIDFEPQATTLRVSGKIVNENKYVKLGSRHTIELSVTKQFKLEKACWDLISLDVIKEASDPSASAEIAAVMMESGIANLCLVTSKMTIPLLKIETTIPKQRVGSTNASKAQEKFYNNILQGMLNKFNFGVLKAIIIASPGFYKEDFLKWLMEEAIKKDIKQILNNKHMFLCCRASSGHKYSLKEVLQDPVILEKLSDVKATKEVEMLNLFFETFETDPLKAYYGYNDVVYACEAGAIDVCMMTDELFRSNIIEERKKYIRLVEEIKGKGGQVLIFSSLHVSGERLKNMTGVAAILRYSLQVPHTDEENEEEGNK
eukprot:TRINITY_DN3510_c0_g1_i1.p1 TRINITY_DN3510_c0_g1~~TRINITY_DN3510_c0_g1_i1.p1  ORF type:complete len:384 (-),score=126.51 TRINITY_DN3510_c0_g1_i1:59-1210(-)